MTLLKIKVKLTMKEIIYMDMETQMMKQQKDQHIQ